MGFPSELPAMRRQTLPAPHPLATALAWIGLGFAAASAIVLVPIATSPPDVLTAVIGPQAARAVAVAVCAGVVPALVTLRLARRTSREWPGLRFVATYLAMLGAVVALHAGRLAADVPTSVDVADCCAARSR
jgi:hypothetical protein